MDLYFDGYREGFKAGQRSRGYNPWKDDVPLTPVPPAPVGGPAITCPKCGMIWQGVMMYSCPNYDCPVQVKVTM